MTQVSKFIIWFWLSTNVNYFQIGRTVSPVMRALLCNIEGFVDSSSKQVLCFVLGWTNNDTSE